MPLRGEDRAQPAYTDLQQIRGGGNGIVYTGNHTVFGLPCVQKTYEKPGRADAIAFREPRLLRELKHDHIVEIIDAQPDPDRRGHVTMVMPHYPGGDLTYHVNASPPPSLGTVIEWTRQIASALDYLHVEKGYLHRDLKPGNIVIGTDGRALLCDFGTAAETSETGHTAAARATAPYQPPEAAGRGWLHRKSDIYSLGLTAIELIDGAFLYHGLDMADIQGRVDKGRRAYTDTALASRRRAPHVPPAARVLLARCVDADPDRRPTAAELAVALGRLWVIDWQRTDGIELDGEWHGTWPARARADKAIALRVTSEVRTRGAHKGKRALVADCRQAPSSGWRTVGSTTSPSVVDVQDEAALSAFFKTVADIAASRFPA